MAKKGLIDLQENNMIITIHQPEYLPWLGFFDRIEKADIFVLLDDMKYQKNAWINRNRIKTSQGWQWIRVPVKERESQKKINEIEIDNKSNWKQEQLKIIQYNYAKAPYFKNYLPIFEEAFKKEWKMLVDLDVYLIKKVMDIIGLKTRVERSSILRVEGVATERLVKICQNLKTDTYLSGPGFIEDGKSHHTDFKKFEEAGIKVIFQDFQHPEYPQLFKEKGFISHLSVIDLLFNCGPQKFGNY